MRVQRCKGTQDLSPEQMRRFRLIEGVFRECCLKWGYEEVRTPTLEYLHLFTSTGTLTPSRLGRVYSFLDWDGWSGERVVLRPDGTIPIARLYIDTMEAKKLVKLFYVTNVFSFEETGKETREKWQCGAELIGAGSTTADIDLILLALEVLRNVGLDGVQLVLSHAGLIKALLAKFDLDPRVQTRLLDQILDGNEEVLLKIKSEKPEFSRILAPLLDLKGKSSGFLKNVKALFNQDWPEIKPSLDNFVNIVDLLEEMGISYQIDITSGRGFEYYTGVMYQCVAVGERICGGGRYDALIPLMGGGEIPASGFALYLDNLMNIIESGTLTESPARRAMVKSEAGEGTLKEAFGIADFLRKVGYTAEIDIGSQEPADFRWLVVVQSEAPLFIVTDRTSRKRVEAQTREEVLAILKD